MNNLVRNVTLVFSFLVGGQAVASMFAIDLDPTTFLPPASPPGQPLMIESNITVSSGTTLLVDVVFVPDPIPAPRVDGFGVDVNWGVSGDTANLFAGDVTLRMPGCTVFNGGCTDIVEGAALHTTASGVLDKGTLNPAAGFSSSLGGVGVYDQSRGHFSGITNPINVPFPVAQIEFTVTGAPGSVVTLQPSGIVNSAMPSGSVPIFDLDEEASFAFDQTADKLLSADISALGATIQISAVPEPSGFVGLGFLCLALGLRRFWRRYS